MTMFERTSVHRPNGTHYYSDEVNKKLCSVKTTCSTNGGTCEPYQRLHQYQGPEATGF